MGECRGKKYLQFTKNLVNSKSLLYSKEGFIRVYKESIGKLFPFNKKRSIGVEGFEPPAPWSQTTYSTKLSHTPLLTVLATKIILTDYLTFGKSFFHIFQKIFHFFLPASRKAVSARPTTHFASVYFLHS